jgi:hypothetical protein
LAGIAAAAVALGVGEVVAAVVAPQSTPLVAVGGTIVDRVPESGKELAIRLFGTNDKLALQVGTVVILALFAAGLGILAARRIWIGLAGIGAFGLIGLLAAVTRPGAQPWWALPSVLGTAAAAGALWALLRADWFDPDLADEGTARRRFLRVSLGAIGGALGVGFLGRFLAEGSSANAARDAVDLPTPSGPPAVLPQGADVAELAYVTPNNAFYRIDTALVVPRIDPAGWELKIHGRVRKPMTLNWAQLLSRPMIERYVTLACVSN